jgi:hypothetical protein
MFVKVTIPSLISCFRLLMSHMWKILYCKLLCMITPSAILHNSYMATNHWNNLYKLISIMWSSFQLQLILQGSNHPFWLSHIYFCASNITFSLYKCLAYLRTHFVQVLTTNASSTLMHHTIALNEHNAYQTSLRPSKDNGGWRGRSQTRHPRQITMQGAHHNQTSLCPPKDKGGRRGRRQNWEPSQTNNARGSLHLKIPR